MKNYGKELILDVHKCDEKLFKRKHLKVFLKEVCERIDMKRCKLCWWDDLYTPKKERETEPHLAGTSVVQFITTSNITIHTLDILKRVYLNLFSCKDFKEKEVISFVKKWFKGEVVNSKVIQRV